MTAVILWDRLPVVAHLDISSPLMDNTVKVS